MSTDADELQILPADPATDDAAALIRAMEDEIDDLYADRPGSIHSVAASPSQMGPPEGAFVVVLVGTRVVGCGGLKRLDPRTCEIKRMYLRPEVRGHGLSGRLLAELERCARELGYSRARLDTGDRQPAAKRLYEGAGYLPIADYNGNTVASFWFEKELRQR